MAEACKICCAVIQGKHYRTLSTSANVDRYSALLQSLGVDNRGKACYICVNKLNKIVNLKSDIISKQQKCEQDVQVLYSELQRMPGVKISSSNVFTTPTTKQGLKRQRTPQTTPRSKKSLFVTPPKLEIYRRGSASAVSSEADSISTVSVGTQTKSCTEDFDVKVIQISDHSEAVMHQSFQPRLSVTQ